MSDRWIKEMEVEGEGDPIREGCELSRVAE